MRPAATKSNQGEGITLEEARQGDGAMVIAIENQQQEADLVMEQFDEIVFGGCDDQARSAPGAEIVRPLNYAAGHPMQDRPFWMRHLNFTCDRYLFVIVILIIYLIVVIVGLAIDIWDKSDLSAS
ncbi:uncharacterized protein LOC111048729 isoform X2 [Nilaparvata lugens]|nr:uncharacterized protein LOC111048729 isoform X2 [Nilaparvata lugens]